MKRSWKAGLFGVLALASLAPAARADADGDEEGAWGPFSATVTLASDYRYKGQSLSARDAVVQGSIDYAHSSGFFAGVWASMIDYDDPQESPAEVDFLAGYSHKFSDETTGSLTATYYWYPDPAPASYNYFEVVGNVSHDLGGVSLSAELAYSPDYSGEVGEAVALTGGVEAPEVAGIEWLSVSGHAGYQWIDDNVAFGNPDWFYYDFGATATWEIFAFDLRYTGTDTSMIDCYGGTNLCEGGVVLSLTANLPG